MINSVNSSSPPSPAPALVTAVKERKYSASHELPWHDGKCRRCHGHTFVLQVQVTGPVQPVMPGVASSGMVADFAVIGAWLTELDKVLDHQHLNNSLDAYPTAERLVQVLAVRAKNELEPRLPPEAWVSGLRFYEEHVFPSCFVEVMFIGRGGAQLPEPVEGPVQG